MTGKVLLIQPPLHPEAMIFGIMDPYGLEILAAGLREVNAGEDAKTDVKIIDLRVEDHGKGLKKIADFNPDIVGITGITIDYPGMVELLHYVKRNLGKDILTVVGGHHVTMVPADFFPAPVDVIVRGPGIEALKEITASRQKGGPDLGDIKGIIFQDEKGHFHETPPRSDFAEIRRWPLPAYDLTRGYMSKYKAFGHTYNVVTTSLGCPFECKFCACWKAFDGNFVARPAEAVVRQIAATPRKYIFFGDDFTFGDIRQAKAIAQLIRDAGIKKHYTGYCRAEVIVRQPELIKMWRDIGLMGLTVGMESWAEEDLQYYNKKTTLEMNHKANEILLDLGIHNIAHLLIKPSYSEQEFRRMAEYNLELGTAHPVFPVLTPLPGTDLAAECRDRIYTKEYQYYDLAHPVMDIRGKDLRNFYHHLKMLYFKNYSYKRWLKAKFRKCINFIKGKEVYKKNRVNAPELISIPYIRFWVRSQLKKSRAFIEKSG